MEAVPSRCGRLNTIVLQWAMFWKVIQTLFPASPASAITTTPLPLRSSFIAFLLCFTSSSESWRLPVDRVIPRWYIGSSTLDKRLLVIFECWIFTAIIWRCWVNRLYSLSKSSKTESSQEMANNMNKIQVKIIVRLEFLNLLVFPPFREKMKS